jgi:hypothetical protein
MTKKCIGIAFVVVAFLVAVAATVWPHKLMGQVMYITRFFEVMLPILAVGALLKYILCCGQTKSID